MSNSKATTNSSAELLDFLLPKARKIIWESFKHPYDTFMPYLRISTNKVTGEKVKLVSWKSLSDPFLGMFLNA